MTIALTPDLEQKLAQKAQELGTTPEDFVLGRIQKWFGTSQQEQPTTLALSNHAINNNEIVTMC